MDKAEWALQTIRAANRKRLQLPFSEFVRKQAHLDPLEVAVRLRNRLPHK